MEILSSLAFSHSLQFLTRRPLHQQIPQIPFDDVSFIKRQFVPRLNKASTVHESILSSYYVYHLAAPFSVLFDLASPSTIIPRVMFSNASTFPSLDIVITLHAAKYEFPMCSMFALKLSFKQSTIGLSITICTVLRIFFLYYMLKGSIDRRMWGPRQRGLLSAMWRPRGKLSPAFDAIRFDSQLVLTMF